MKQKLYDLKIQILKSKIKANVKLEIVEQIFQIETDLAINFTHCCTELLCGINGWEGFTLDKKYIMLFENTETYGVRNDVGEIVERNKQYFKIVE
jgi:hypothetical protein